MTSNSTLSTQPSLLENTTNYDALLQQNLSPEELGQTCIRCNEYLPLDAFGERANTHGTMHIFNKCKKCYNEAGRSRRAASTKAFGNANYIEYRPPEGTICMACPNPMTYKGKHGMTFDHDPITSTFRGWICKSCNTGIGNLGDTIEGLERALGYLKQTTT